MLVTPVSVGLGCAVLFGAVGAAGIHGDSVADRAALLVTSAACMMLAAAAALA